MYIETNVKFNGGEVKTRIVTVISAVIVVLVIVAYFSWSQIINFTLPADSRPGKITFAVETVTPEQFETLAKQLNSGYAGEFNHIERFKKANITAYEGPKTCLSCHKDITYKDLATGQEKKADLMENLTTSSHYRFFTTAHPNVYGFNGELADNFPMGKIDRPCPKPGSFAMTAWAGHVITDRGDTLSEGCGQCHIGGEYQVPLGEMMPGYRPRRRTPSIV